MRQAKPNTKSILQIAKRQTVETETLHSTCALEDWATILLVWFCMFYDVVSNAIQSGSKQWVIRWSSVRNQTSNLLTNFGFNKSTTLKVWTCTPHLYAFVRLLLGKLLVNMFHVHLLCWGCFAFAKVTTDLLNQIRSPCSLWRVAGNDAASVPDRKIWSLRRQSRVVAERSPAPSTPFARST